MRNSIGDERDSNYMIVADHGKPVVFEWYIPKGHVAHAYRRAGKKLLGPLCDTSSAETIPRTRMGPLARQTDKTCWGCYRDLRTQQSENIEIIERFAEDE